MLGGPSIDRRKSASTRPSEGRRPKREPGSSAVAVGRGRAAVRIRAVGRSRVYALRASPGNAGRGAGALVAARKKPPPALVRPAVPGHKALPHTNPTRAPVAVWATEGATRDHAPVAKWATDGATRDHAPVAVWATEGATRDHAPVAVWATEGATRDHAPVAKWATDGATRDHAPVAAWATEGATRDHAPVAKWATDGATRDHAPVAKWATEGARKERPRSCP